MFLAVTLVRIWKLEYPQETIETQIELKKYKAILWKIKAHTVPTQYYNNIADHLSEEGRTHPANDVNLLTPLIYSFVHCNMNDRILPTSALPHTYLNFIPHIVRNHSVRTIIKVSLPEPD